MPADRQHLGRLGEQAAADLLTGRGFCLLARNLRTSFGEIDLLMRDGDTVVVVEVKTQTCVASVDPLLKVDARKQRTLRRLAEFVRLRYPDSNVRIDVVTAWYPQGSTYPRLSHYENCITF